MKVEKGVKIDNNFYNCSHCLKCNKEGICEITDTRPIWYSGCSELRKYLGTHIELYHNFYYIGDLK